MVKVFIVLIMKKDIISYFIFIFWNQLYIESTYEHLQLSILSTAKNGIIPILVLLKQIKQTTNKKNVKLNVNFMANSLK